MTVSYSGSNIAFDDGSTVSSGWTHFKNRIINGTMVIDQRNAGANVTLSNSTQFPVDRFGAFKDTAAATCKAEQSSTVPNGGFAKSLLWTTTTGSAAGVNEDACIRQYIEGYNIADFGFGTSDAQSFTLSFWVRSSVAGTYGVSLANSAANRCYMATYTVNATNTWERKTITVVGDTSGTWLTDNGLGLRIFWDMGSGTNRSIAASSSWGSSYGTGLTGGVKISANTGAIFYLAGVQLERGSTASSFEYRSHGTELALCQRYCVVWGPTNSHLGLGTAYGTTAMNITVPVPVPMRTTPTPSKTTTGGNWLNTYVSSTAYNTNSTPEVGEAGISAYRIYTPGSGSGWTGGSTTSWCQIISGATFTLSAEL
jgi:hypothetical protein